MQADQQPTVSVIAPAYGNPSFLTACLESVGKAAPAPVEVLVVSDSHQPDIERVARDTGATFMATRSRGGPARARNLGARMAKGEILLFLDADVLAPPDIIGRVQALFRERPDVDALFGSYDAAPVAGNFISQYRNLLHHYVHQHGEEEASTFWAGCGAIRRDVFLEAGGFSKSYRRPAIEDIELGGRLRAAGHRILLCKALQVKHLKRWSLTSMLRADFFHRAIPWTELLLRQRRLPNDLNLRVSSRLSTMLVFLMAGVFLLAWRRPALLVAIPVVAAGLLLLNRDLYRFFGRERGAWFAVRAVLCHWLYYFYSGLGLLAGLVLHLFRGKAPAPQLALNSREAEVP